MLKLQLLTNLLIARDKIFFKPNFLYLIIIRVTTSTKKHLIDKSIAMCGITVLKSKTTNSSAETNFIYPLIFDEFIKI